MHIFQNKFIRWRIGYLISHAKIKLQATWKRPSFFISYYFFFIFSKASSKNQQNEETDARKVILSATVSEANEETEKLRQERRAIGVPRGAVFNFRLVSEERERERDRLVAVTKLIWTLDDDKQRPRQI